MLRIDAAERRARLGVRHCLAAPARAPDAVEAARSVVALHSTDATSVYLSALARMEGGTFEDVERALYGRRTLVRVTGMRRTVFAVPLDVAPIVISACGRGIAARERKMLLAMLKAAGVSDEPRWLEDAERAALDALAGREDAGATELAEADPKLGLTLTLARGKNYETRIKAASRVLLLLAAEGRIVRTRPVGSWRSSQYRWSRMETWLGGSLPVWGVEDAQAELARLWLQAFGPAMVEDFAWWSGLTAREVRKALSVLPVADVDLSGAVGVGLTGQLEPADPPAPWVALLPALDPTPMGWKRRDWYMGAHGARLFDTTGNVGPTVWCDGRVVGGWAQRDGGEVLVKLLEDVGGEAARAIHQAAEELMKHIGDTPLAPRARGLSPIEQELKR